MKRRGKLTDAEWREVFRLRCKSKSGDELSTTERALVGAAYDEDENRYGDMEIDVFNATVPFGSNVRLRRTPRKKRMRRQTSGGKSGSRGRARSTMADVRRAKTAFDAHRDRQEALGFEVCLVVVGYASGREPFRLLGRVSADTGADALPDPPLTDTEMQPVALAAKMALAKVLAARKRTSSESGR
jgi:hypothetical protein